MNNQILLDYILFASQRLTPKGVMACSLRDSGLSKKQVLKVVKKAQQKGFACKIKHITNNSLVLEAA